MKKAAQNSVIAALYAILTIINPIGYGPIQLRISDMLFVLPFFNRDYIPGIVIGVAIANFYSPLGILDVLVGITTCLISYSISKYIRDIFTNVIICSITIGTLVGAEINCISNVPFATTALSVGISTFIITFIGTKTIEIAIERMS